MTVFKCKLCGASLDISEGMTVTECAYCGTKQTLPRLDDDRRANLYDRANHFRRNNDFDKAAGIFEQILNEDTTDAETYWSLVLCRYGIEYVEDPATRKRVPTVNRAQFTSVFDDEDYKSALRYADAYQREVYEAEAAAINEIQKGILAISQKEEPFDVFVCYKETDENGRRTQDSVLATELYHELTREGFKIFFSRITLEDKLGIAYEPYIFAALHSAKVMVALGTKPAHFNAVWVKNEWSRYLALIKNGAKKTLIPAYRDMDPYDLPEEFSHLQAQDMAKLGFMQDLTHGIRKIIGAEEVKKDTAARETVVNAPAATNIAPLLKRAFMFLEDGDWDSADEYCEKVLDQDPENAQAYLGKLMAEKQVQKQEELKDCDEPFDDSGNYQKAMRFGDSNLKATLAGYTEHINTRNENARLEGIYSEAVRVMQNAASEGQFNSAGAAFKSIRGYKDAEALMAQCLEQAEASRKNAIYMNAIVAMNSSRIIPNKPGEKYRLAIEDFQKIPGWRDADEQILICQQKLQKEIAEYEEKQREKERRAELARTKAEQRSKRRKKILTVTAAAVCGVIMFLIVLDSAILPPIKYNNALKLMDAGEYAKALALFWDVESYKNNAEYRNECFAEIEKPKNNIAVGGEHTVGLKADGTVVAVGSNKYGQCDVSGWKDMIAVAAGQNHTVGLTTNGTVMAVGYDHFSQCKVSSWKDIVAVAAGSSHTVGLKADGTVVAVGDNSSNQCNIFGWKDIVAVAAGGSHTIGLKTDGTVVAVGSYSFGKCGVSSWENIVAIAAGRSHTVGLKADGTVVAVGNNSFGQCNVSGWKNIVMVAAGVGNTVGLKADGTVVAVGNNDGEHTLFLGTNVIIAIATGDYHTVGLKSDGTVVAVGVNSYRQCDVSEWRLKTD